MYYSLVSFARHSVFLSHAGRIRVVGYSHSVSSVVLHFAAARTFTGICDQSLSKKSPEKDSSRCK